MNKLLFLSVVLVCVSSCSSPHKEHTDLNSHPVNAGCITPKESMDGKVKLENGIRSHVKFLGEPENLGSISNKIIEYKIPALSLAVINQGRIEWADVYQNAHFPAEQKLDCTSLFQAASLSKPVTLLAAVRMHSAGKIDLNKNIQNYLKSFFYPLVNKQPITRLRSAISSPIHQEYHRVDTRATHKALLCHLM